MIENDLDKTVSGLQFNHRGYTFNINDYCKFIIHGIKKKCANIILIKYCFLLAMPMEFIRCILGEYRTLSASGSYK
jgi:hypothetical protein